MLFRVLNQDNVRSRTGLLYYNQSRIRVFSLQNLKPRYTGQLSTQKNE